MFRGFLKCDPVIVCVLRYNIFRRAWHAPFNWIEWNVFRKFLSPEYAYFTRFMITRGAMFYTVRKGIFLF